ncbi:MAG: 2-C-methyl-D-erythritol 4-phosphate cytidylyltransferase, partial [Gemmatimonadetes bacterium]|nr:2-C-methyl-D-erythritol 4-phosphate cytidylyltransferase [Gemmatimonadota bacterium]
PKLADVVAGGSTRQESVYLGLMALDEGTGSVLIHDAARPCVEQGALEASVLGGARHGAVISATPATDTMKIIRDGVVEATPSRSALWRAQTPQTFEYRILRAAHERAREEDYVGTDDAELVERAGYVVRVLEGSPDNIKVTTAEDLEIAERILRRQGRI